MADPSYRRTGDSNGERGPEHGPDRTGPTRRRLAPEARCAQLLDVAAELFSEFGTKFTSSQLATAAGVSEGTVFRYFPDMESLMSAARRQAVGLANLVPQLRAAADLDDLGDRLRAAGAAIASRIVGTSRLVEVSGQTPDRPQKAEIRELLDVLTPLFDTNGAGQLEKRQQAAMFLGLLVSGTIFSVTHNPTGGDAAAGLVDVDHIVTIFLHGVLSLGEYPSVT